MLAEDLAGRAATGIENARLYADAQKAIRLREHVLAIVSHDLRNQISVVSMAAGQLDMGSGRGRRQEAHRDAAAHGEQHAAPCRRPAGYGVNPGGSALRRT